jgi:tRNA(fMet)-specific endonuclease VapC
MVEEFLFEVPTLSWDTSAAECYGTLRASLEAAGTPLGELDTLIAAHALANGLVLVSADKAFARVAGLKLEDWSVGPS